MSTLTISREANESTVPDSEGVASPREIRTWFDELRGVNPMLGAARVIVALNRLHFLELTDARRLQALEAFRQPTLSLVDELQARFETEPTPLSIGAKDAVELAQALLESLANGYRSVVKNFSNNATDTEIPADKAMAIQRSILLLGQILFNAWVAYRSTVTGVWCDLYACYELAEQNDLLMKPVLSQSADTSETFTTTMHTFQHIVLLSTADTTGMQMGECGYLYELLKQIPCDETSSSNTAHTEKEGIFVFDPVSDNPPMSFVTAREIEQLDSSKLIDCRRTIENLQELMKIGQSARTGQRTDLRSLELLNRVRQRWSGTPKQRQSVRSPREWTLPVCAGIAAIHYYALNEQSFSQFKRKIHELYPQMYDTNSVVQDALPGYCEELTFHDEEHEFAPNRYTETNVEDGVYHRQIARIMDESAGGVRLRLFAGSTVRLLVGNIVSTQSGAAGSWRVGVVRWLNANDRYHVDAGIEFISTCVESVAIQHDPVSCDDHGLLPALLLYDDSAAKRRVTLIAPGGRRSVKEQTKIIDANGVRHSLRSVVLKQRTSSFEQIVIELGEE